MDSPTVHIPVLLDAVLAWSGLDRTGTTNRIVVDGTLGGAGHAWHLIQKLATGDCFIGIDRDPLAVQRATTVLDANLPKTTGTAEPATCRVRLVQSSYRDLPRLLTELEIPKVHCILLDLGLSSDQLEDRDRGFSFRVGGDLDMRFCQDEGIAVRELLARAEERELADIIYQYGEERFSRRIAKQIVAARRSDPIATAEQLAALVHRCVPGQIHGRIDSATRTFQALRIAVNQELDHLRLALERLPDCLAPGGRLMIISFHSLEDRMVKHAMREDLRLQVLTKKPIVATDAEVRENARSRSAKLRVAERV